MKALMRLIAVGVFVAILGFCIFGFVATFEPMPTFHRVIWRTVYSLTGIAITLGLFRLLRCQCRRWLKQRHDQSRLMTLGTLLMAMSLTACAGRSHSGPYDYPIEPGTTYLSEEKAIAIAKETMVKEGYDLTVWQLARSDERLRGKDNFIKRFRLDPNQARVLFSNGEKYREVSVVLKDGRVTSAMFFGM